VIKTKRKLKKVAMEEENRKLIIDHDKNGNLVIQFYEEEITKGKHINPFWRERE